MLSIASAGDMPLSLLALGAEVVDAVDIEEAQIRLAELKLAAALQLEAADAVRFLGYIPAPARARRAWYGAVRGGLVEACRNWWDGRVSGIEAGVIWMGRYERFVSRARRLLRPWLRPRIEALVEAEDLTAQRAAFDQLLDRPVLRRVFRLLFHPLLYGARGVDPRALQHRAAGVSMGDLYFERFCQLCTGTRARDNPFLQLQLLGRVANEDVVPTWLSRAGIQVVRRRADHLSFRIDDVHDVLFSSPVGAYNRYHLSNMPDWLPRSRFASLLAAIIGRSNGSTRLVWRSLHSEVLPPADVAPLLAVDIQRGRALMSADRFPLYHIMPAEVVV